MKSEKKSYILTFWIAFCFFLFTPLFYPSLKLFFFSPFLAYALLRCSYPNLIWTCILCGSVQDLFSHLSFGMTPLALTLTVSMIRFSLPPFFIEKASSLPLLTFLISFVYALVSFLLIGFSLSQSTFSFYWVVTDLLLLPLADSLYAFLIFFLPFKIFNQTSKMIRYALIRKKRSRSH